MLRLSYVSFQREARWMMILAFAVPAIGFLFAIVDPCPGALARLALAHLDPARHQPDGQRPA